jgi:hypothetical protein
MTSLEKYLDTTDFGVIRAAVKEKGNGLLLGVKRKRWKTATVAANAAGTCVRAVSGAGFPG